MFEQMKGLTPKKKVEYYFQYYGLVTAIIVFVLAVAIYGIIEITRNKKDVAAIMVVNGDSPEENSAMEEYLNALLEDCGYNSSKEQIALETGVYAGEDKGSTSNYLGTTKIQTELAANTVDMIFFDDSFKEELMNYGAFDSLEKYLSQDLLDKYADRILYSYEEETDSTYPAAIQIDGDSEFMKTAGWYEEGTTVYVGICFMNEADVNIAKQIVLDALGE